LQAKGRYKTKEWREEEGRGRREVTVFIRPARDADLPQIIWVWQRNIMTANTAEDIAALFSQFKKFFFVAS